MRSYFQRYAAVVRSLPASVRWLTIAAFVNASGIMVTSFVALFLTSARGLSVAAAGEMVAMFGVGSLIGGYVGGRAGDRVDSRIVLATSFLVTGVGFLVLSTVTDLTLFRLLLVGTGAFEGAFRPAYNVTLTRVCPPEKLSIAYTFYRLAFALGCGLAALLAGATLAIDPRFIFWLDGGTSILAGTLVFVLWRRIGGEQRAAERADERRQRGSRDLRLFAILVAIGGVALVYFQVKNTYPNYLREVYGMTAKAYGSLFAIQSVLIIAIEPVLTERVTRVPRHVVAAIGSVLVCFGFALAPWGRTFAWALMSGIFWSFGSMLLFPAAVAMVSGLAPTGRKGSYLGLYQLVFSTCSIAGPAGGGWVWKWLGPDALFTIAGLIGLASGAVFFLGARPRAIASTARLSESAAE